MKLFEKWRTKMESRKKNWNTILNNAIASISLIFATLLLSLCFVIPNATVKALTKSDIQEYGIYFVSAKTKVRSASNIQKVTLSGKNQTGTASTFDTYEYAYNKDTENIYYNNTSALGSGDNGLNKVNAFEKFTGEFTRNYGYIPYGVNYFDNMAGNKEEIFYDEINDGDYVLLNNNTSHLSATSFNVENFYLSMGTPFTDSDKTTTPLYALRVDGMLYSNGQSHYLLLNDVEDSEIGGGKYAHYWNQYFDTNTMKAYTFNEKNEDDKTSTYNIENVQGKYVINFRFIRYNSELEANDQEEETFTYTFYLLDGSEYSQYPTIHNADILTEKENELTTGKPVSYYYNFTLDTPYITYNPSKYNVSYNRLSNKVLTNYNNITSTFEEKTYNDGSFQYPLGIVSYYNSSKLIKTVYILGHYNSEKTLVEYLYLTTTASSTNNISTSTLETFQNYVENGVLDFEYKTTVVKTKSGNNYTTTTYRTEEYSNYRFINSAPSTDNGYTKVDEYTITATSNSDTITYTLDGTNIAVFTKVTDTAEEETPEVGNDDVYYTLSNVNASMPTLDYLINLDSIQLEYSYELKLDELGEYTINYAYVCPVYDNVTKYYINSTDPESTLSSKSSDFTTPEDINVSLTKEGTEETSKQENLPVYYIVSGVSSEVANQFTINNIVFTFNNNQIVVNGVSYDLDKVVEFTPFGSKALNTIFNISTIGGQQTLTIKYQIAQANISTTTTTYTTSLDGKSNYITKKESIATTTFALDNDVSVPLDSNWEELQKIINCLKESTSTSTKVDKTTPGTANLHIFGSIAYFNKTSDITDSGYSKLKQIDNRNKLNYNADITSRIVEKTNNKYLDSTISTENIKTLLFENYKEIINKSNIVITDRTPITWENFSTLKYNDKISQSYILRFEDYSFDNNGDIVLGDSCVTSSYTKDTPCHAKGLYVIAVFYTYDGLPQLNKDKIYYQVFSFIIDKSNPKLIIEVENKDGTYEELGTNTYTNKNIRISWEVPSYFKNDVYIDITKSNYVTSSAYPEFKATYRNGDISTSSGTDSYVRNISQMSTYNRQVEGTERQYYYVTIKDNQDINGNYEVTIHYNNNGNATHNALFTIDKINISGLALNPVVKNSDGTYAISQTLDFGTSQIINSDFTFRFDSKKSGAKIYAYYNKIDFSSSDDYDKIINTINDKTGISTKFEVNGSNISTKTPYEYNYTNSTSVASENLLTSLNSAIFLFYLEDQAGNTCRYIVFYDKTEPRFVISPEPDSVTHTVTDTARVIWGDYKAIKVGNATYLNDKVIDFTSTINNYTVESDDDLTLALRYMNSYNNKTSFNDLKVEKIGNDYYILIPITNVSIEDRTYNNTISIDTSATNNYFFFTVNPITTESNKDYINLPTYDENGKVITENNQVKKVKYEVTSKKIDEISYRGSQVARYLQVTYKLSDSSTATIYGVFGDKTSTNPRDTYVYTLADKINNKTSSALTVTRDLTDTVAFGLFDYTDNVDKAISLDETESTYSASKMFISSKHSDQLPEFEVTYRYYAYDTSLYTQYNIKSIELLTSQNNNYSSEQKVEGSETYLRLKMEHKTDGTQKIIYVQLTNSEGNACPIYSYPYSLEGQAIVHDDNSNPSDVYTYGSTYNSTRTRVYSLALNTTTDTNKQRVVSKEGLYIFQRTYTDPNLQNYNLGDDNKIAYYVYYVDRSGIINVNTSSSSANILYTGSDIGFTLGSNYTSDPVYKTEISASTIQNNQKTANNYSTSNSDYISASLFDTNKIQVEFRVPYDKYNFSQFVSTYKDAYLRAISDDNSDKDAIIKALNYQLFYTDHFQDKIYKTDLTLKIGGNNTSGSTIINEQEKYYSEKGMSTYLKGNPTVSTNKRNTLFNFFYAVGNNNSYIIDINDQAGYLLYNSDGSITDNYLSNSLEISFDISHDAPEGDLYGKYYGRHDYDNNSTITSNSSLPTDDQGHYAILSKYLKEGQLEPLSDSYKSVNSSSNGEYVKLYSTNNETMIFSFIKTNDEFKAQIDPNNIKIYKGGTTDNHLIFNRVNGNQVDCLISKERQKLSFIENIIDDTTYYAIIIFDNNLDEILDEDEKKTNLSQYRLLDADQNPDNETYYIKINYVGNEEDYQGADKDGKPVSYYNTTYEIIVDREKPTYNLTKLMSQDKYVYNNINTAVTTDNYATLFEQYMSVYNFQLDEDYDFYRSDIENYYFALDCRKSTSFLFENIDSLDNNSCIYIRPIADKNNYKFSVTPDDYKAYYTSVYLQGHPQFTPSNAVSITDSTLGSLSLDSSNYYKIQFTLENGTDDSISAYFLNSKGIFEENCYYEIIEEDETGNYRVYAVYIPSTSDNKVVYTYQENSNLSSEQTVTILYGSMPYVESNGMNLHFTKINMKDNFLRANITIKTDKFTHLLNVILDPNTLTVSTFNRTAPSIVLPDYTVSSKDSGSFTNTDAFVEAINYVLDYYYSRINDKSDTYYSQYGYNVSIEIVDRTGISVKDMTTLYNYQISYAVTGSILTPTFKDNSSNFVMSLSGQKGSTYLTEIVVYKFNKQWHRINVDNSSTPKTFDLPINELKKPIDYYFTRGVYKFVFKDNFNRTNEFFHEFGINSTGTVAGGSLDFGGNSYSTLSDGYTYSARSIKYTYDSSVYNVYIKFIGDYYDEYSEKYTVEDGQNEIVYNSSKTYNSNTLERYGISAVTSGNITTITFLIPTASYLNKYHIKTILASTSDNYTWDSEKTNSDIFVYDKKIAISTAIKDIKITNTSGNTLDTSEKLNLTEDFRVMSAWNSSIPTSQREDFNSRIILTRKYNDNGVVKTTTSTIASGQTITQAGDYTAYVINDLGMTSKTIEFTRGEGEITTYAVYAIDNSNSIQKELSPSSYVTQLDDTQKSVFTYFITSNYFNYKDLRGDGQQNINISNFENFLDEVDMSIISSIFGVNQSASRYIDVRINSNLNIKTSITSIGYYNTGEYPYIQYQIYSDSATGGDAYTYVYIQIVFITETDKNFVHTVVNNAGSDINLAENNPIIQSTSESVDITISLTDTTGNTLAPLGDTIYIDRYYNGTLVETTPLEIENLNNLPKFEMLISHVGLHEFVVRDLAGRIHQFNGNSKLQIYLINQVQFTTNGEEPINNQIFNGTVEFEVNMSWFTSADLSGKVSKNGIETSIDIRSGKFTIAGAGYYTVKMSANTSISATPISVTYNFVIIDTEIATSKFSISKSTNFSIEKLVKIVGNDKNDITDFYSTTQGQLILFDYNTTGNCIYDVTLKKYDDIINDYRSFNFRIWINDEEPIIQSSIKEGTNTKDTITINFNAGIMYSQIGAGYITLNDQVVAEITSSSQSIVDSITIDKKGTYWLKIYSNDGTLRGSYKFVKSEPVNGITKIILVCVAIAVVVVIVLFFLIRRRGKYR